MDAHALALCRARARVVKALAHPTRLFIVDLLEETGDLCLRDLTARIGATGATVSRHLALLRAAGIVQEERRGAEVHNSLGVKFDFGFFCCVERLLARDPERAS